MPIPAFRRARAVARLRIRVGRVLIFLQLEHNCMIS
jgi:hypothetical protein